MSEENIVLVSQSTTFLLKVVELGEDRNERLLTLSLHTVIGTATLVCAYAPTLYSIDEINTLFMKDSIF